MINSFALLLIIYIILAIVPSGSSMILICRADETDCDGKEDVKAYDPPAEYFGNTFAEEIQARLFSQPEYTGSVLDVPEGITELANYPIVGGSIVVREGWRVVITTLQGARFVEKLYVLEGDIPHVSFAEVRIMRVLVERI